MMRVLHILRSKPDEMVEKLCEVVSQENASTVLALYKKNVSWKRVVENIFLHDKIICWW